MSLRGFELALRHHGNIAVLTCSGEFKAPQTVPFDEAVMIALDTTPRELQVDTTAVYTVARDGLISLLQAFARCCESRTTWNLIPGPIVADALARSDLSWLFADAEKPASV